MAYPVVPPNDIPMDTINQLTANVLIPPAKPTPFTPKARITKVNTNVPITSLIKLKNGLRIAGPVENTASFVAGSSVSFQCG